MLLWGAYGCSSTGIIQNRINDSVSKSVNGSDQINLITYNIQDIFGKAESKLDASIDYLNREDYDFVLLQELFNEGTREYVLSKIDTNKYKSIISRIDYNSFPDFIFNPLASTCIF